MGKEIGITNGPGGFEPITLRINTSDNEYAIVIDQSDRWIGLNTEGIKQLYAELQKIFAEKETAYPPEDKNSWAQ